MMKIKTFVPCCQHLAPTPVSLAIKPKQDRKCSHCKSWWRADVRQVGLSASVHAAEWTFVGK